MADKWRLEAKYSNKSGRRGTPVWDLPVRVFHWALVLLVISQIVTATIGGNAMQLHASGGYAILTLVVFRILWGFAGGTHARFRDFVQGPGPVVRYAKSLMGGTYPAHRGHNPLGGWSVLAMLGSLLVQAATGLFANDDVMMEGPLAKHVSGRSSEIATAIHDVNAVVLISLLPSTLRRCCLSAGEEAQSYRSDDHRPLGIRDIGRTNALWQPRPRGVSPGLQRRRSLFSDQVLMRR